MGNHVYMVSGRKNIIFKWLSDSQFRFYHIQHRVVSVLGSPQDQVKLT